MSIASTGISNCSTLLNSNNKKVVQLGQKLFHGEGHELILESHEESSRNAFIYIGLILFVYLMAVIAIVVRYLLMRSNRDFMALTTSPRQLSKARRRNSVRVLTLILFFLCPQRICDT